MPLKKTDSFQFGGVDSRSNPANYPAERLLRCKNFSPMVSGQLRLRYGYSKPTMSANTAEPIHSAAYYEQWAGDQFVVYGQGTALNQLDIETGAVSNIGTLSSGNPWGHFRSSNRVFMGNGVDMMNWDGTLRKTGIRSPNTTESSAVVAAATNSPSGTFATSLTSLATPGYQFYMVYLNPVTGHVGNRVAIGARVPINTAGYSIELSSLPDLSGVDVEWVKGIGRTNDGGQVPYWLIDDSGNRVVAGNTATTAVISNPTVDTTQELPYRNGVPPALNKFAKCGSKIFGARDGDVNLYYTEDDTDLTNGNFVGVPAESWAGDNIEPFPTAEVPTTIHAYQMELWAFSKNYLAIWSLLMYQQGQNPWRGPYNCGCAGQRAWVETPYGPHWITPDKQLFGWTGSNPIPVSSEYETSLLGAIGDRYVADSELVYFRNAELQIDRLYIKSKDANGNPLIIVHDFNARDMRNQVAQGYNFLYSGMVPNTFIGSGYTPRQNVRDTNGREKLWTGDTLGSFYQLEDGSTSDNGATYTGDAIALINAGDGKPLINAIEWQGDENIEVSFSTSNSLTLEDFAQAETERVEADNPDNRYQVKVGMECRWVYARFQLTSHPADGNFAITDPPFVPMPTYGLLNMITPKFGRQRPEAP